MKQIFFITFLCSVFSVGFCNSEAGDNIKTFKKTQFSLRGRENVAYIFLSDSSTWKWVGDIAEATALEKWKKGDPVSVFLDESKEVFAIRVKNLRTSYAPLVLSVPRNVDKKIFPEIIDFVWDSGMTYGLLGSTLYIHLSDGTQWKIKDSASCRDWEIGQNVFINSENTMINFQAETFTKEVSKI